MSTILEETKENAQVKIPVSGTGSVDSRLPIQNDTSVDTSPPAHITRGNTVRRKRKGRKGTAAFISLALLAGLAVTAYKLGWVNWGISPEIFHMQNVTQAPEGSETPAFTPIDPSEFFEAVDGELVDVPDETGLELPPLDGENSGGIFAPPANFYAETPNVNGFYTHAMQDESYVYFLRHPFTHTYSDLMRVNISTGSTEPVVNANEVGESIYSFTLFKQNMITCEYNRGKGNYTFYRVPKALEDAQSLFEYDSPALMNVHDNKVFMLFALEGRLGVYDPETDAQPVFIDLEAVPDGTEYLPEFSVMNGYLYYGISHDGGKQREYLRRSLYTGELSVMPLPAASGDALLLNPCWDGGGNAYYGSFEPETGAYSLETRKSDGSTEVLSAFNYTGEGYPLVALKDEYLIAAAAPDAVCKYETEDFTLESEAAVKGSPFAVTKDFLVTTDGIYRLFDFGFTPFVR